MRPAARLSWPALFVGLIGCAADAAPPGAGPVVRVTASYPGASARVVDETVVAPLLNQIRGLDHVARIESEARNDGAAVVTVRFDPKADPHLARQELANRVSLAEPRFPDAVRQAGAKVAAAGVDPPGGRVALTGPDVKALRAWADAVAARLKAEALCDPTVSPGPDEPALAVEFDREKAARAGVSMASAVAALKAARGKPGAKATAEETGATEVPTDDGKTVRLDAVAAVKATAEPPLVRRVGDERAVYVTAAAGEAAKWVTVAEAVGRERKLPGAYKAIAITPGLVSPAPPGR